MGKKHKNIQREGDPISLPIFPKQESRLKRELK
jgi:hypothetical protein